MAIMLALTPTFAAAYDCNTDCGDVARFHYPCPTLGNPRRLCWGREPVTWANCQAAKEASCKLWEDAANYAVPRMKPEMVWHFNSAIWYEDTHGHGSADDYDVSCIAAGVAVCGALGAQLGGPWGGVISGALGTFVSARACSQSKTW